MSVISRVNVIFFILLKIVFLFNTILDAEMFIMDSLSVAVVVNEMGAGVAEMECAVDYDVACGHGCNLAHFV